MSRKRFQDAADWVDSAKPGNGYHAVRRPGQAAAFSNYELTPPKFPMASDRQNRSLRRSTPVGRGPLARAQVYALDRRTR